MKYELFSFGKKEDVPGGPRKKGLPRLRELLAENLSGYFLSGVFATFGGTFFGGAVWAASQSGSVLMMLLTGGLTGALLGPLLCGITDTVLRSLRDMPGSWWETYKRAWRQNATQSVPFGILLGVILSGQIFGLRFALYPAFVLLSMVILIGIFLYVWPQIVLIRLKNRVVLKNAMMLMLAYPMQTFKAVVVVSLWAFLLWLLFPVSLFLWTIGGVWFPTLLAMQILSGVLEDTFHVEQRLIENWDTPCGPQTEME